MNLTASICLDVMHSFRLYDHSTFPEFNLGGSCTTHFGVPMSDQWSLMHLATWCNALHPTNSSTGSWHILCDDASSFFFSLVYSLYMSPCLHTALPKLTICWNWRTLLLRACWFGREPTPRSIPTGSTSLICTSFDQLEGSRLDFTQPNEPWGINWTNSNSWVE